MTRTFVEIGRLLLQAAAFQVFLLKAHAATFPIPSGPFNTTLTISQLTDLTRLDPYSPTPAPRSLMVSLFHPSTCIAVPTPYMDPITASWTDSQLASYGVPAGTFESLYLQTCPHHHHHNSQNQHTEVRDKKVEKEKYPLILFSPGLGEPRLYYSALAQEIASKGFTVVTIDHPYDAGIVAFPNNSTIYGANITTDEQILADLTVRSQDVSFVLNQLSDPSITRSLIPGLDCPDTTKAGIFGHSLGGATAAQAMLDDHRLLGGINLDGSFFGSVIESGLSNPFLLFAHEGKNITADASWDLIWPKLTGFKRILELQGSTHGTFLDFLAVIDVLGLKGKLPSEVGEVLGSIDGMRALQILGTYVGAFFDMALEGKHVQLLDGPCEEFPEVRFEDVDD